MMKILQQAVAPGASRLLPGWAPLAAMLGLGLAILLALPAQTTLTVLLVSALGIGIGVAELRRHGGRDVPALPYVPED